MKATPSGGKRQHVIDTAYRLFKRGGYHATGIDRIIAEADVAKMTMYRNFPKKDGLIVEVLNYRGRRFEAKLDDLVAKASRPEEKVGTIFDWYARWFQSPEFHGCLFAHALAEFDTPGHPVFEAASAQKNSFKKRLRRILEPAMPAQRVESVAAAIFMLFEGATLLAQMGQGEAAVRDAREAATDLIAMQNRRP